MMLRMLVLLSWCVVAAACTGVAGTESSGFPPRPADIRTGELGPCSMLSPAQEEGLDLYGPEARVIEVDGQPSPTCVWLSETDLSYSAQTIPIGAERAVTEHSANVIQINGYGAVRTPVHELTGGAPTCQVTVDAAPGQSIRVQAQATGARPRSDDEMCRIATDVTAMVMTTVVATAR